MDHDSQVPAGIPLRTLRRDLGAYGELQDSFARIAQGLERDAQQSIADSLDLRSAASSLEPLLTSPRSVLSAQQDIADSLGAVRGDYSLETLGTSARSALDARGSIADSLGAVYGDYSLETLGASARSALDARESIAEQWRASALAFSEAMQPTETLLAGWRKGLRRNEEQLWETTRLLFESQVNPGRGVGSQQVLTPASPSFPASTSLQRGPGLADDIFRGPDARQGLLADSCLSRCLDDVQLFFDYGRPVSAIDRAHSALHRVLELLAEEAGMQSVRGRKVHGLFRYVRTNHPIFILHDSGMVLVDPAGELAKIIEDLTWFRNHCSLAHPTDDLPSDDVAWIVARSALVVIHLLVEQHAECPAPADRYWHRRN